VGGCHGPIYDSGVEGNEHGAELAPG
jgi:hypothetical protein